MKLSSAILEIQSSLDKGNFISFFCHCSVSYSGRAESFLDFGDRLILIKQDKGVLIHQPTGGMPINYLRPPASIDIHLEKDTSDTGVPSILFHAISGTDEIIVTITHIHEIISRRLEDGEKQTLSGSEAQMSDMIREQPHLIHQDFKPLSREEHTKYGFIDVFGHLGDGTLAIIECKRFTAGLSAVTQLHRYVQKMKSTKGVDSIIGIMAAPAITANAQAMLDEFGYRFALVDPPKRHVNIKRRQQKIEDFFS